MIHFVVRPVVLETTSDGKDASNFTKAATNALEAEVNAFTQDSKITVTSYEVVQLFGSLQDETTIWLGVMIEYTMRPR
jgi:hypothetical protein